MTNTFDSLLSDLVAAHALILAERAARRESEARAARAEADLSHAHATALSADALIARLRLEIEKLRRTLYGARSERKERLIDQLEMQLEDALRPDLSSSSSGNNTAWPVVQCPARFVFLPPSPRGAPYSPRVISQRGASLCFLRGI